MHARSVHLSSEKLSRLRKILRHYSWKAGSAGESVDVQLGNRVMTINTGKMARLADGSATVKLGETSVLSAVVSKKNQSVSSSFVPLTVDYNLDTAVIDCISPSYRRMDYSNLEVLTARMIDRSLRPLFPQGFNFDTHIDCRSQAFDRHMDPAVVSINAASAALFVSDIPWSGPIGAVQVGLVNDDIIINPTVSELRQSRLNLIISAIEGNKIVMIDASSEILPRYLFQHALEEGVKHAQYIIDGIKSLASRIGKEKRTVPIFPTNEEMKIKIHELAIPRIKDIFHNSTHHKKSRDEAVQAVREEVFSNLKGSLANFDAVLAEQCFSSMVKTVFRELIFETGKRCDGRALTDLRNISCEVDLRAPVHGSSFFQRGQTQVQCTATFASPQSAADAERISAILSGVRDRNFFLNYQFPSYSTNELGKSGGKTRRELGHGALAEKALRPVIPSNYPFTIKLKSEVLESNGSSSMASVCAGSLSLYDAGVPIIEPASGVAIGLITKVNELTKEITDHRVLTDLMGIEDYMGDMDFKMAGTKNGITALQLDTKLPGIPLTIVEEAIDRATIANGQIIDIMDAVINKPREERKPNHPVVEKILIPVSKRSKFLGVGGSHIKRVMKETGVEISEIDNLNFQIFAGNKVAMDEAKNKINELLTEDTPEFVHKAIYKVKITELKEGGVMVQLHPSMADVFIPNRFLSMRKVNHSKYLGLEAGKDISVQYFSPDPITGHIRLSRTALFSASETSGEIKLFKKE